jgi:TolB-like protein
MRREQSLLSAMCSKARCERGQSRTRVNVQLIDAASGAHIWADRFDEDRADLFKLQDDIVARLANGFGYGLARQKLSAA